MPRYFVDYGHHGGHGLGWAFFALFVVIVIAIGVFVFLWWRSKQTASNPGAVHRDVDEAQALLRLRYARGEISSDEFRSMSDVLRDPTGLKNPTEEPIDKTEPPN